MCSQAPDAHSMSINSVCWSNEIVVSNQRIQWVKKSLTNVEISVPSDAMPILATVSSDKTLVIWKVELESLQLRKLQ